MTDNSGLVVTDRMGYGPFGTLVVRTGTTPTPYLYGGLFGVETDPNGLLYMRARYYHPGLRRFLSPDPIGFAGGLNWYMYAGNDPYQFVDPSGWGREGVVAGGLLVRAQGAARAFVGLLGTVGGVSGAVGTSVTGFGVVAGGAGATVSYAEFRAGGWQAVTGEPQLSPMAEAAAVVAGYFGASETQQQDAAMLAGMVVGGASAGSFSRYVDITARRSLVHNRDTNVTRAEFEANLLRSEFSQTVSSNSNIYIFDNGNTRYTVRDFSSDGRQTAEFFQNGRRLLKIRLQK